MACAPADFEACAFWWAGFTIVASSVFQALGKGLLSMSISIFRQLVLVLPLAYLFSLTGELNLVWWSFPVAEVLGWGIGGLLSQASLPAGDPSAGAGGLPLLIQGENFLQMY